MKYRFTSRFDRGRTRTTTLSRVSSVTLHPWEHPEHAGAPLLRHRRLRPNDHSLGHLRGAGDLQLRRLLDLHEAHATHTRDGQPGVIAVVRHEDARLLRGFDDERPLRDAHGNAIDGE